MKKLYVLIILSCLSLTLPAQFGGFGNQGPKIKGKIQGTLVDSLTSANVGFASISVKRMGSKKILNGTLSGDDGKFSITDLSPGKYQLEVSFLGYADKILTNVETTKKSPDNNLGVIYLVSDDILLDEVQITEKRALIENKVDRIVFNAEDDSSIAGGDATDVLRKVPNLSVDLDGNVSIRGSQNIRILINGKPSGMFSTNVADALKMFPADQIKKVEVITSPGAKYDAEGSGGIINIITKKSEINGVAGTVNASVGNRQNNTFVNLNVGKGRFGSTINGAVFYSNPIDGAFEFSRTDIAADGERTLIQTGRRQTERLGFNGSASAFYDINAYNAINTSFTTRGFGFDVVGPISGSLSLLENGQSTPEELFSFDRLQVDDNIVAGYDWNIDYTRKFEDNNTQELVIAYQLSRNDQDQDILVTEANIIDILDRDENLFNDGDNVEHTAQIDYTHPLSKAVTLETGAKTVIRDITSDFRFSNRTIGSNEEYVLDASRSDIFRYDQDVIAGYGQLKFPVGKLLFVTGLRYERTEISGFQDREGENFENSYDNFIPNFTVSRALKNFRNLKLSYSKRLQRPGLRFVNPFNNNTDQLNVVRGNPTLDPEISHQVEVGYNTRVAGFNIFGSAYYRYTDDIIEQILIVQPDGVSLNSFDNVGTNNSLGLNLFINKSIKKLNFRIGGDIFTYNGEGVVNGEQLSNSALQYQIFTGGDYAITSTIKADFFGFFRSDQPTLQGFTPSFSIYGFGIRKDIKSWSIGLRVIEPFVENKAFVTEQEGEGFRQFSSFEIPFRSVGINVRYKFGKVDFKERRSKIKNTDQKQGDDQGGGQGGPPQRN